MSDLIGYLILALVPKKYDTIGHWLVGIGMTILIVIMIFFSNLIWILGHIFLLNGILGIYYSKTKHIGSAIKSAEKEGIEKTSLTGEDVKVLRQNYMYVFYVIIVVGIICHFIQILQMGIYAIYYIGYIPELIGYSFLISGLLILYNKKTGLLAHYLKKKRQKKTEDRSNQNKSSDDELNDILGEEDWVDAEKPKRERSANK